MKNWLKCCCSWMIVFCGLMGTAQAAAVETGSIVIENEQLNHLVSGDFVYEIPGVGTLTLDGAGSCTYEYSKGSWWPSTKRHRLLLEEGQGEITWSSARADRRVVLTRIKLSGYAHGAFDFADVIINDVKERWNTDGFNVSAYPTEISGVFTENRLPIEVTNATVGVIRIELAYEIYDYVDVLSVRADEQPQWTDICFTDCPVLERKLYQGWNTLCLPFACPVFELGEGVVAQQFSAYDPVSGLSFSLVDRLEPNVPYLVYCPEDIEAGLTFGSRFVYPATSEDVQIAGVHFVSNYQPNFSMAGKYGVADGRLLPGGEHACIQATSAYFLIGQSSEESSNKVVHFEGTDGTTSVSSPQAYAGGETTELVYDLQGRVVGRGKEAMRLLPSGLYLYQGRKILVR